MLLMNTTEFWWWGVPEMLPGVKQIWVWAGFKTSLVGSELAASWH